MPGHGRPRDARRAARRCPIAARRLSSSPGPMRASIAVAALKAGAIGLCREEPSTRTIFDLLASRRSARRSPACSASARGQGSRPRQESARQSNERLRDPAAGGEPPRRQQRFSSSRRSCSLQGHARSRTKPRVSRARPTPNSRITGDRSGAQAALLPPPTMSNGSRWANISSSLVERIAKRRWSTPMMGIAREIVLTR